MNIRTFYVGALLVAGLLPLAAPLSRLTGVERHASHGHAQSLDADLRVDWPTHFRDQPLTQLPLSDLEQRFARRFPGAIARFSDGRRTLVLRHLDRPTRQLHPATDCFRALGYAIERPRPVVDDDGVQWSCFAAARDGMRLRVCERIHDSEGRSWTDTSSWFWSAQYGGGPWQAITTVDVEVEPR